MVGLLGPNGAGKTTSFYMIAGFVHPTRGEVLLDEQNISRWPHVQTGPPGDFVPAARIFYLPFAHGRTKLASDFWSIVAT